MRIFFLLVSAVKIQQYRLKPFKINQTFNPTREQIALKLYFWRDK